MLRYLLPAALTVMVGTSATAEERDPFEAVVAAPGSHHILLETDRVRVLRVSVLPGATEPIHVHKWPSVMYFEQAQPITYITYDLIDGKPVEKARVDVPAEALSGADAGDPEGLHAVQNRGVQPFLAVRVELKDGRPLK